MAFDEKYYLDKEGKLVQKQQKLMQDHIQASLTFANEINEVVKEINEIAEWKKQNAAKVEAKTKK
jgi:chlorite dismutase